MNPWLVALLIIIGGGTLFLLYGFFIEPWWIKTREIVIPVTPDKPYHGKSFVFFSDMHTGSRTTPKRLDRQMRTIMKMKPDAILFGGDLVEEPTPLKSRQFRLMVTRALASLEAPEGKWAILGNHDVEAPRFRAWATEVLRSSGFTMLENEGFSFFGLPVWGFANTLHDQPSFDKKKLHGLSVNDRKDPFTLYLVHESDWFPDTMPTDGPGLVLCGHSHHGQVTLFGLPLTRPAGGKRYWRGRYELGDDLSLIVSAGLGTVHIHARFFARPDILFVRFGDCQAR
ncbi:MAG TPA: metallophosphoesterase [Clostridia bacterium]|nr:metallophosphoesterase [Clostridia bacterium]